MVFRQIIHDDLGCASYLVGDEKASAAAVVDPRLEIQEYLEIAEYTGVSIVAILETHNHADHLSGHGRLAAATGAPIYIHGEADPAFAHLPIADGFELELGQVVVRALHAASVGLLELRSYLGGGIASWLREGRPLERIERLPVAELCKRAAESDLQLLDVREHGEWDLGHIPGSLFQPWHELDELPAGLDPERPVAVLCASGERAATAASLLQRLGAARVTHVTEGGVPSWGELGNPIEITADPTGVPSS